MVMVVTRMDEIFQREGFMIEVYNRRGRLISNRKNGILRKYPFNNKLKGTKSVSDWIEERFEKTNPGYTCKVLKGDGKYAVGQTLLKSVRATY